MSGSRVPVRCRRAPLRWTTPAELRALTGEAHFSSITFRCFKAEGLERTAEDYGHVAVYRGGVVGAGSVFVLDSTNAFEKDRPRLVHGGNTATMLASESRFAPFFTVTGSHATHLVGHFASSSFRVQLRVATEEGVVWGVPACNRGGAPGEARSDLLHCMQSCMCPMVFVSFTLVENLFLIT